MKPKRSNLLEMIQQKRRIMEETASISGFTSEETVRCSQELDELLNQFQMHMQNTKANLAEERVVYKQMIMVISHEKQVVSAASC